MKTKFLVMDIDGTLTDGKIYMGANGELMKAFNIKDGCGIHDLLIPSGVVPIVITGRKSEIVSNRCAEIGIKHIFQGCSDKIGTLINFLREQKGTLGEVAYIGDDLNDLECMRKIKDCGGIIGVPQNASHPTKDLADYVATNIGGEGAVRDFIEYLLSNNRKIEDISVESRCFAALDYLTSLKSKDLSLGRHDVDEQFFYNVQEYVTKYNPLKHFESHRKYVDIQMLITGEENLQVIDANKLQVEEAYNEDKERITYHPSSTAASIVLRKGSAVVLYPKDAHRTIAYNGKTCNVKKIVGKIKI